MDKIGVLFDKSVFTETMRFLEAEGKAFKDANINEGEVKFTCPICGGEAVGIRHMQDGRINGLGSGCSNCGFTHS